MDDAPEDDPADVTASRSGDAAAFARLIRRHQDAIARRMGRFTRDRAAVEELVHEVFVQAYFSLGRYRGDAPLAHWLQRIATRVGYRYWKTQSKRTTATLDAAVGVAAPDVASGVDDGLLGLVEQLPPRDRLVLTLLYLDGRSVAEAADLAGWTQSMVKVQAFRARAKLKKLVVEHDMVPEGARHE